MGSRKIYIVAGITSLLIIVLIFMSARRETNDSGIEPISDWQTYQDYNFKFLIKYPKDFSIEENLSSSPFEYGMFEKIPITLHLKAPNSWNNRTNLVEAGIDVIVTSKEVGEECLKPIQYIDADSEKNIGGSIFHKFTNLGAAAGNTYEITSYRALKEGECVVADIFIHNGNIRNYDSAQGIKEFDRPKIVKNLEEILETLTL